MHVERTRGVCRYLRENTQLAARNRVPVGDARRRVEGMMIISTSWTTSCGSVGDTGIRDAS